MEEPKVFTDQERNVCFDGDSRICPDRWMKNTRRIILVPGSPTQCIEGVGYDKGYHHFADRETMRRLINTAVKLERQLGRDKFEVVVADVNSPVWTSEGGFIRVLNQLPENLFSALELDKVHDYMEEAKVGNIDPGRRNKVISIGFAPQFNVKRSKCTMGIPKPQVLKHTNTSWGIRSLLALSAIVMFLCNGQDGETARHIYADRFRNKMCSEELIPNEERDPLIPNIVEALTATDYEQRMVGGTGEDEPYADFFLRKAREGDQVKKDVVKVPVGDNLCGNHLDVHNPSSENCTYRNVISVNLWHRVGKVLRRSGKIAYGRESISRYINQMLLFQEPLHAMQVFFDTMAEDDIKEIPSNLPGPNDAPVTLSGPHLNKLGVYYAGIALMIREVLNGFPKVSDRDKMHACLCYVAHRAAYKPLLWYEGMKSIIYNDGWIDDHAGRRLHIETSSVAEFGEVLSASLRWMDKNFEFRSVPHLRMQPNANLILKTFHVEAAVNTIMRLSQELAVESVDAIQFEDNLPSVYHFVNTVFSSDYHITSAGGKKRWETFGITGMFGVGPVNAQMIIGVLAVNGQFPQSLVKHSEVPATTNFEGLYSMSTVNREKYERSDHYQFTQRLLKAGEFQWEKPIAYIEELICQAKKLSGYDLDCELEMPPNGHFHDTALPGIPYLEYNVKANQIYSTDHTGKTTPLQPMANLTPSIEGATVASSGKAFWKQKLPNLQKNPGKYRKSSAKVNFKAMFPIKRSGNQIRLNVPEWNRDNAVIANSRGGGSQSWKLVNCKNVSKQIIGEMKAFYDGECQDPTSKTVSSPLTCAGSTTYCLPTIGIPLNVERQAGIDDTVNGITSEEDADIPHASKEIEATRDKIQASSDSSLLPTDEDTFIITKQRPTREVLERYFYEQKKAQSCDRIVQEINVASKRNASADHVNNTSNTPSSYTTKEDIHEYFKKKGLCADECLPAEDVVQEGSMLETNIDNEVDTSEQPTTKKQRREIAQLKVDMRFVQGTRDASRQSYAKTLTECIP